MNTKFNFNAEYLEECFKRRKKPEERKYPKKDWPVGYEPTKKEFEEWMEEGTGIPVSFHWKDIGGGKKRGVFTPIKKEIEKDFKENTGINITYHGKNSNEGYVISGKFKDPEIEKQKNELIEESVGKKQVDKQKENLNRHFIDDGKGLTYSIEKKNQNGIIKETYHEPRSEEEKEQSLAPENSPNNEMTAKQEGELNKKEKDNHVDYQSRTQEQLITEINRLKVENEELKNNQTLTNSEKENRIKQNQQTLEKLESNILNSSISDTDSKKDNNNSSFALLLVGGAVLVGLVSFLVAKSIKKDKKS